MKQKSKVEAKDSAEQPEGGSQIAERDFEICQNDFHRVIKKGDDLKDVPAVYIPNLITEGVLPRKEN